MLGEDPSEVIGPEDRGRAFQDKPLWKRFVIVFAGPGNARAFITTAHRGQNSPVDPALTTPGVGRADVWVFDAAGPGASALAGTPLAVLALKGDTPRALAATDDRAAGRIYNVADPDNLTELELTQLVASAAGYDGGFAVVPTERLPPRFRFPGRLDQHWAVDSSRIRRELGYREPTARGEAIRATVRWERANPPGSVDPGQFDYAAEDLVINRSRVG